ncbi:uncharacterized protein LOC110891319 [Helianthus annuus]|uniref:uncharacterized protein LOC110891319 n=1 Tax=Helianthus annuus TaxID=4232 RepID=UPI000B904D1C|nr:uncharacterized protein LOC110891319 [Helianthus annuus]
MDERKKSEGGVHAGRYKPPFSSASFQGLASRVVNIEGKTLMPRRGFFPSTNHEQGKFNVIDELTKITVPVSEGSVQHEQKSDDVPSQNKVDDVTKPVSYAESVINANNRKINFRSLASSDRRDDCDVVLPKDSVRVVTDKLANTLYGYFLGDRIAYPVVDYFVKNNWKKYGLQKSMMNANGFFFFKFADRSGMMSVLEEGPWIIRSQPLFLCEWNPSTKLVKSEVKKVQLWVKIHDVPLAAYTEDGLSLIATAIGEPKLLDSYTTSMCLDSWGRISYARALTEVSADKNLKEEITMAVPDLQGEGYVKETMYVEYEWSPHRCSLCCVFGHADDHCPKQPRKMVKQNYEDKQNKPFDAGKRYDKRPVVDEEGYTGVQSKKAARKAGFPVNKPKTKFEYRPVGPKPKEASNKSEPSNSVFSQNPFSVLNNVDNLEVGESSKGRGGEQQLSDDEEVIEVYNETDEFIMEGTNNPHKKQGASTPSQGVSNVLESHMDVDNLRKVRNSVFCRWEWTSNGGICDKGTRIIIGWNPDIFDIMVLAQTPQMVGDKSWIIMGDFNSALHLEDKSLGASSISTGMRDFQACVSEIEVMDINQSGFHYTWNQKPKRGVGLLKKLDRVMGNTSFITDFPNVMAVFYPYRLSDHSPCDGWEMNVNGVHQFRVVKKLKCLKSPLRALLFNQGNLHKKVADLRDSLDDIQAKIDKDPMNSDFRTLETKLNAELQVASLDEEGFLKQKSKMEWLRAGDSNTAFFHASVKSRNHRSRIQMVTDVNGEVYEGDSVQLAFVKHYEVFLGSQDELSMNPTPDLFTKCVNPSDAEHMIRPVTVEEVKKAMFSIGNDKAPGPDGFTAAFFKVAWPIVGNDVSLAVVDFFNTGKLLGQLNHTLIALVPKKLSPLTVTDYRPIACCNVLFKCVSKIIVDRIKDVLHQVVSINQSAFVPGRKITDNILLTQELMHNYHRNSGPPRCAFKVDIQKAYDTVDWCFLKNVLLGFGFKSRMVEWIMMCVSTTTFSLCVNGNVYGYFKGKRGLRQGDPLSPYLFTLVMEILTCILQRATRLDNSFKFHNKCEKQRIINLCFADDLFLFARWDINSVQCIMNSLSNFTNMSGLVPSIQKSTGFFCNVPDHVKNHILSFLPFVEGTLPVKYLGVPLISSGLVYKDCSVLVERLDQRISNWKNKLLSFTGRLQLINSVLSSMHIYWSSVFILPVRITLELVARMRNFLWSSDGSFHKGFSLNNSVQEVYVNGTWGWPVAWRDMFPVLIQLDSIHLMPNTPDRLMWKDGNDLVEHSSSQVWHSIRRRAEEVDWVKLVWFPQCIPKHAFLMWLVIRRKLLTQDKILQWDFTRRKNMNMMCCLLCYANVDAHDHLFFDCNYATQVWIKIRDKGGMSSVGPAWNAIIDWLGARANSKSAINFISRLIVAAAVYFVWQERNARLFRNQNRPPDALANLILQTVRYKLIGVKFKECNRVRRLLEAWEIYNNLDD